MLVPQKKLKIEPPYDPTMSLLNIYPTESKSAYYRNTCIPMFITALFPIAKLWNWIKCLSIDDQIKETWYIYTMEFNLALKNNKIMSALEKWIELESSCP
jgi:hypothetical protein